MDLNNRTVFEVGLCTTDEHVIAKMYTFFLKIETWKEQVIEL